MADYSEAIKTLTGQQNRSARMSVMDSVDANPDEAAESVAISNATGVPSTAVYGDFDEFNRNYRGHIGANVVEADPDLVSYINSHPLASKVSKGDLANLAEVSRSFNAMYPSAGQKSQSVMGEIIDQWQRVGAPRGQWMLQNPSDIEFWADHPQTYKSFALAGAPLESAARTMQALTETGGTLAGALYSAVTGDRTTGDWIRAHGADVLMDPGVQASLGPLGMLLPKRVMPLRMDVQPSLKVLTDHLKIGSPWVAAGEEPPPRIGPFWDYAKIQQAALDAANYDKISKNVKKSSTYKISPEMFQNFLRTKASGTIEIPVDAIRDLYGAEEEPHPQDGKLGWISDLKQQIDAVAPVRGYVTVAAQEWHAKVPKEVEEALKLDLLFRPEGLTENQAKVREKEIPKEVEEMAKEPVPVGEPAQPELPLGEPPTRSEVVGQKVANAIEMVERSAGLDKGLFAPERNRLAAIKKELTVWQRALDFGLTAKQAKKYIQRIAEQVDSDRQAQLNAVVADIELRKTAEWQKNEEKVREEVEGKFDARPDIAVDNLLREGILGDVKLGEVPKLDITKIPEELRKSIPKEYMSRDGFDPQDVGNHFGFSNARAMLERLAQLHEAGKRLRKKPDVYRKMLIDDEVERQMQSRYGKLDEQILMEAQDHVSSLGKIDIVADEVSALYKSIHGREAYPHELINEMPVGKGALRAWARESFGKLKHTDPAADLQRNLNLARQHGDQAELVTKEGAEPGLLEALRAKQSQQVSLYYAMEAKALAKRKTDMEKLGKRYYVREVEGRNQQFTNQIRNIMATLGLQLRGGMQAVGDLKAALAKDDHPNLKNFVEYHRSHLDELEVADFLQDPSQKPKTLSQLTVDEFKAVHDSIRSLDNSSRKLDKIIKEGEVSRVEDLAKRMAESLETFKYIPEEKLRSGWRKFKSTAWNSLLQMEALMHRWDRGDPDGVFTNYISTPLMEAANNYAALEKKFSGLFKALADKTDLKEQIDNPFFRIIRADGEKGELRKLNRGHLRAIMQHMGNSSNFRELIRTHMLEGLEDQVTKWVHDNATKEDWNFVSGQGKIFNQIKRLEDRLYRHMAGIEAESIPLWGVSTKFGNYNGWYHPLKVDALHGGGQAAVGVAKDVLEGEGFMRATTRNPYLLSRRGLDGPVSLELSETPSIVRTRLHDLAFREAITDAAKLFYHKGVREAVRTRWGVAYEEMLIPYLKDVANSHNFRSDAQAIGQTASEFLRANLIGTLIGFNPGTLLKHGTTALINSMSEVGPLNFLREMKNLFQVNAETGENNWSFATNTSEELGRRMRHYIETLSGGHGAALGELQPIEALKMGKLPSYMSLRESVIRMGASPVAYSDLLSAVPTWLAEYKTQMEAGELHGTAVSRADRAVRRAHGSSAVPNRPALMRSRSVFSQWVTSLYGFFSHILNRQYEIAWKMRDSIGDIKNKGDWSTLQKNGKFIAGGLLSYVFLPALVEELVTPLTRDDRESWGSWAWKGLAKNLSSSYPGVRDAADFVLSHHRREPSVGLFSSGFKAGTDVLSDVPRGKEAFNRAHAAQTLQHFVMVTGAATGLMNAQEGRTARFITNYALGREHPRHLDEWVDGIWGGTAKIPSQRKRWKWFRGLIHGVGL